MPRKRHRHSLETSFDGPLGKVYIINAERHAPRNSSRYVFWFESLSEGHVYVVVWGSSMEYALDEAVDYIAEHHKDVLANDEVIENYKEFVAGGMSEEEAQEAATEGVTIFDGGNYIESSNWGIQCEDPSREDLIELLGRDPEHRDFGDVVTPLSPVQKFKRDREKKAELAIVNQMHESYMKLLRDKKAAAKQAVIDRAKGRFTKDKPPRKKRRLLEID